MSEYEEGRVYCATLTDQAVCTRERDGEVGVQLLFGVRILARLKDDNNPDDGVEECASHERQVLITIPANEPQRLHMAMRDLERLGFADDDVTLLHPDHPQFVSLVGRDVHVRMKVVNGFEYWNFAWPRERPRPASLSTLEVIAARLKDQVAEARKRSAKGKGVKEDASPPATTGEKPLPDVTY